TFSEDGTPQTVRGVLRVITARKMLEMDLSTRVRRDRLTGLPNRTHLLEMLETMLNAIKGTQKSLGYVVMAIDNMTYINEAIGPDAADSVILGALKRMQDLIPDVIEVGRVGGDQFGVILRDYDSARLSELCDRLLTSFREQPVDSSACPVQVSVSMGGMIVQGTTTTAWETMIRAEQALREAQRQGRNAFVEYQASEERTKAHRRSLEIGQQTLLALKGDGMRLAFQPIVDAVTGKILSFEALIRMVNQKGDFIPAGLFIPVIEQLGLVNMVDRKVLDMAIEFLANDPDLVLAVNVSGLTASQKGWPDVLREKFVGREQLAKRLIIEITETAAILDIEETKEFVHSIHELGGKVALDDFGSGFTSIRYLRTLAVDTLKIDREMLSDVTRDADQQVMVNTLVALAKGLGLETVAEGVETEEVAAWLRNAKVDHLQGYYFGRPEVDLPANILKRYEEKHNMQKAVSVG
ncbi:MAG: bifunctional diguanylate cyclase/phosphodiesterase, partial [Alphaproteobacteria bacterium]|nr:bifunctional diguanylate cyclase/phosphodiesterase [Alphaproteobacteria bacterium]